MTYFCWDAHAPRPTTAQEILTQRLSVGSNDNLTGEDQDNESQSQLLKIMKDMTSKGFVRNNYKKNLVDLTDVKINLKGKSS